MQFSNRFRNPSSLFSDLDHLLSHAFGRPLSAARAGNALPTGVYEADEAWFLRTDLPGFTKDDVSLHYNEGVLHLSAQREDDERLSKSNLSHEFRVPKEINPGGISARLEDGVLEVTLPKQFPTPPEKIEIAIN